MRHSDVRLEPQGEKRRTGRDAPTYEWATDLSGNPDGACTYRFMRERMRAQWTRMEQAEPQHRASIEASCRELKDEIDAARSLPPLLSEIRQLQRLTQDLSAVSQRELKANFDDLYSAFRTRVQMPDLLLERVSETNVLVARWNKRLSAVSGFDELFVRANELKRWVALHDFPPTHRAAAEQAVRSSVAGIFKLEARHKRWSTERDQRSTEVFAELFDIEAGVAAASADPSLAATRDELVGLNERLRSSRSVLDEKKFDALAGRLDQAFSSVKQARTAFAVGSEREFAQHNEGLSEALHALERSPTRESAMEAIEVLKAVRKALREHKTLLKRHRDALFSTVGAISRAVDEVFNEGAAMNEREISLISSGIDRLEQAVQGASDWRAIFTLIGDHKEQSAAVRNAAMPIREKRQQRVRLEAIWDEIEEKLERLRHTRTQREEPEAAIRRLERQGWLFFVSDIPRIG